LDTFAAAVNDLPGPPKRMIFLGQGCIKGLIVGRSAEEDLQEALRAEIAGDPDIPSLLNAITMQMGPDVMLAVKVRMRAGLTLDAAVASINSLEKRIKAKFPEVAWCFVEPDVAD
jgi:divalent metal cation (Fe/Co/Zn/Cd) transporter